MLRAPFSQRPSIIASKQDGQTRKTNNADPGQTKTRLHLDATRCSATDSRLKFGLCQVSPFCFFDCCHESTGGLASQVRARTELEQFDLGGFSKGQCASSVSAAFDDLVPLSAMVRLSFVVGGGKGCRQKYSDDLPKDFTNALAAIGFNDDKAASLVR